MLKKCLDSDMPVKVFQNFTVLLLQEGEIGLESYSKLLKLLEWVVFLGLIHDLMCYYFLQSWRCFLNNLKIYTMNSSGYEVGTQVALNKANEVFR